MSQFLRNQSVLLVASRRCRGRIRFQDTKACMLFHSSSSLTDKMETNEQQAAILPPSSIKWTTNRLTADQILKVDKIFHKLLWLDLFETSMLNDLINQRLGMKLSPKQNAALEQQLDAWENSESGVGGRVGGVGDGADQAKEEAVQEGPKLVDIKLTGFDEKSKIKVIKEVRAIAGLGLKEAKELVESAPTVFQKEIKLEDAEKLQKRLQDVGAEVELV